MPKVLAFSGSNHSQSINTRLLRCLTAKAHQAQITVIDLNDFPLPIYSLDIETQAIPEAAYQLRQIINEYDALIIASPEHNGSMPAFLKNTIDWLSRIAKPGQPFFGEQTKPVLLISTSPGANGGATNIKTLSELMPRWGGDVKATYSLGSFYKNLDDNSELNPEIQLELQTLMSTFEQSL